MMLTTAQLDVTVLALREFISLYSLPGYEAYDEDVRDAKETLNTLLTIRKGYENTAPHHPA